MSINKRKTLKESDFDWVGDLESPLGDLFTEDDYVHHIDSDVKINIVDDRVIYNLTEGEFIKWVLNDREDWVLMTLIETDGTYVETDTYVDSDYINYIGDYIDFPILEDLQSILDDLGEDINVSQKVSSYNFEDIGHQVNDSDFLDLWDDFTNESLDYVGISHNETGWNSVKPFYNNIITENDIKFTTRYEVGGDSYITISLHYPFHDVSNLTNILTKELRGVLTQIIFVDALYDSQEVNNLAATRIEKSLENLISKMRKIIKTKQLNESNEWDWVEDIKPGIGYYESNMVDGKYICFYFSPSITKKQYEEFVLPGILNTYPNITNLVSQEYIDHIEIHIKNYNSVLMNKPEVLGGSLFYFEDYVPEEILNREMNNSNNSGKCIKGNDIFGIKSVDDQINENDGFDWVRDIQPADYRFFEVYQCNVDFDGECLDNGGSTFIKLENNVVRENQLWEYGIDYVGGPGDDAYNILEYLHEYDYIDNDYYDDDQFVVELSKDRFCKAVGQEPENLGIC